MMALKVPAPPNGVYAMEARAKWVDRVFKDSLDNTTLAALFNEGGIGWKSQHTICHAFMWDGVSYDHMVNFPHVFYETKNRERLRDAANGVYHDEWYEMWARFHTWLLRDDLFGKAFITNDLQEAVDYGALVDLECPAAVAMTALIASRRPHEYKSRMEMWYALIEEGMHPRMALFFSDMISKRNGNWVIKQSTDGHQAFDTTETRVGGFLNLMKGEMSIPREIHTQPVRHGYEDVNDAWFGDGHLIVDVIKRQARASGYFQDIVWVEKDYWSYENKRYREVGCDTQEQLAKSLMKLMGELTL